MCVCTVVNLKVTLIHSHCSNQQKTRPDRSQGTLPKKYDFIYSSYTFLISVCSVTLTALLFRKLNKQGLLSEFHARKCNGCVVYRCDLFARGNGVSFNPEQILKTSMGQNIFQRQHADASMI